MPTLSAENSDVHMEESTLVVPRVFNSLNRTQGTTELAADRTNGVKYVYTHISWQTCEITLTIPLKGTFTYLGNFHFTMKLPKWVNGPFKRDCKYNKCHNLCLFWNLYTTRKTRKCIIRINIESI